MWNLKLLLELSRICTGIADISTMLEIQLLFTSFLLTVTREPKATVRAVSLLIDTDAQSNT